MARLNRRADHVGKDRQVFAKNRLKVLQAGEICAICGRPIDKKLKYPDKMSATVDHIIPIAKGGHPSDINNLQIAHWICNRYKSDKMQLAKAATPKQEDQKIYLSHDWKNF